MLAVTESDFGPRITLAHGIVVPVLTQAFFSFFSPGARAILGFVLADFNLGRWLWPGRDRESPPNPAAQHIARRAEAESSIRVDAIAFSPDVQKAIEDARSLLSAQKTGSLTIESVPSGCRAYLNGRRIGETRAVIQQPSPGMHSIQVEGGAAGRVYLVEMGAADFTLRIDVLLDQALRTDGPIARLDCRTFDTAQLDRHVAELARAIGATAGLSLRQAASGKLVLRNSATHREALLSFEASEEALGRAVAQVLASDGPPEAPRVARAPEAAPHPSSDAPSSWTRHPLDRHGPLALSIAGGLALATGWSIALAASGDTNGPSAAMITGLFGGVGMLTGNTLGWQDPTARHPSLAAWLAFPVGIASIAAGAAVWFINDDCPSGGTNCGFNTRGHLFGTLLVSSGLGLVSFPFGYWTNRRRFGPVVSTSLDARSSNKALHMRLSWRL